MTIVEAASLLRTRKLSAVELTRQCLDVCAKQNPCLNAFLTLTPEQALADAAARDAELASGVDRGSLHGIPIAHKDLMFTKGVLTTAGSLLYQDHVPQSDAAVVERLAAAGAVTIGKTNLHELAYGITSNNPHFGPVRNSHNPERIAGGSSGGSAVAVAAGMALGATGTDTGGSIRIPAAFCGIVGLKPTFGLVSRYGVFPLGLSLDHIGPMTSTVRDAALMLDAMAGYDPRDPGSRNVPTQHYGARIGQSLRGIRVGLPDAFFPEHIAPDAAASVRDMAARAEAAGATVHPVDLPSIDEMNTVARVLLLAEASATHERALSDRTRFGADVLALLDQGRLLRAVDYIQAQRLRSVFLERFAKVWENVDCLFTPAVPFAAPPLTSTTILVNGKEQDVRLATTWFSRSANLLGYPALALPSGWLPDGLPLGLQIIGRPFDETKLLQIGAAIELPLRLPAH